MMLREVELNVFSWICRGVALVLLCGAAVADDNACGDDIACVIEGGEYYAYIPERVAASPSKGAIFFLHGYKGKAVSEIRQKGFRRLADDLGIAFITVQGLKGTWSFPTAPRHLRDEFSFFDRVLDDVSTRFHVDPNRTLLTGFSSGAFMTWYLACDNPDRFSGYLAIAGAFWQPLPDHCAKGPLYLFHVHGMADQVVPLGGRPLGDGKWIQGDVFESFDIWLRQAGLKSNDAQEFETGHLSCEHWAPKGGLLELCLHEGGHSVRSEWIRRAWLELAKARGWPEYATSTVHARCRDTDNKLTKTEQSRAC